MEILGVVLTTVPEWSLTRLWTELPDLEKLITAIIALSTILLTFVKKVQAWVMKPVKRLYYKLPFIMKIVELERQHSITNQLLYQLQEGVSFIKKELSPNGNTSLKDSVMNTEKSVIKLRAGQKVIYNNATYGILEFDENGHLVTCNDTVLNWSDKSLDEVLGKGYLNIFHADDREWVNKQFLAAIFDNRACDIEPRIYINHEIPQVRFIVKPVTIGDKVIGFTGTLTKK